MNWLDDRIPLYSFSWMDSGPTYHFALHGRLFVLTLFLAAVVLAALARSRVLTIFFGLLTVATFHQIPLQLTALALLSGYFFWLLQWTLQKQQRLLLPALGFAFTSLAYAQGYLSTEAFSRQLCQVKLKNLATAVEMYGTDHHLPPARLGQLREGHYFSRLPECRGLGYAIECDGQKYSLVCRAVHPLGQEQEPVTGVIPVRSKPPEPRLR